MNQHKIDGRNGFPIFCYSFLPLEMEEWSLAWLVTMDYFTDIMIHALAKMACDGRA